MSDRLAEMSAFVEVEHRRSFVRAAEQLGVNVSAVSRAVAALEARLGVRCFNARRGASGSPKRVARICRAARLC